MIYIVLALIVAVFITAFILLFYVTVTGNVELILSDGTIELWVKFLLFRVKAWPKKRKLKKTKVEKGPKRLSIWELSEIGTPKEKDKSFLENLSFAKSVLDEIIHNNDSLLRKVIINDIEFSFKVGTKFDEDDLYAYDTVKSSVYLMLSGIKSFVVVCNENADIREDLSSDTKYGSINVNAGVKFIWAVIIYIKYFM